MNEEDVAAVLDLEERLFPEDAWSERAFREELAEPTRHYIVAETDRLRVVGYAGLRIIPPEGDVQTMAVAEPWWGYGIGSALLSEALATAEQRGVAEMFLEVRADNPRAQGLYRRFGFEKIGLRHGYYATADAIVMHRTAEPGEES